MHPRLQELVDYTEQVRTQLLALIDTLNSDQWSARAADDGWTIRDVVGHLHLVEDSSIRALFRTFRRARDGGLGREQGHASLLDSLDWSQLPVVVTPMQAPAFTTPNGDATPAELRERLTHSRAGLRTWAAEADGFALADVTFPHPVLGVINLYQWVLMIGQHERRHIGQIQRILEVTGMTSSFSNPAGSARDAGARYTATLLQLLGDRDPLQVWSEHADAVDALVAGVSPADAIRPEKPGKWCIAQVVSHLVDTETVYAWRIRHVVAEDSPAMQGYDQDLWASRLHYTEESLDTLRAELRVYRGRNLRFVQRLSETERARTGLHSERGPESVWHIVRMIAAHDLAHHNQLARIKAALGIGA